MKEKTRKAEIPSNGHSHWHRHPLSFSVVVLWFLLLYFSLIPFSLLFLLDLFRSLIVISLCQPARQETGEGGKDSCVDVSRRLRGTNRAVCSLSRLSPSLIRRSLAHDLQLQFYIRQK